MVVWSLSINILNRVLLSFVTDDSYEIWFNPHCEKNWWVEWQVSISQKKIKKKCPCFHARGVFCCYIHISLLSCSVFDVDDDSVPPEYRNGFTFSAPNEQVGNLCYNLFSKLIAVYFVNLYFRQISSVIDYSSGFYMMIMPWTFTPW